VEVTTQHAESQRLGAWQDMKERLFLDWISLQSHYIAPGYAQVSVLVKSHLTDTATAFPDQAAMPTSITAHGFIWQGFGKLPLGSQGIKYLNKISHLSQLTLVRFQ
jgi:hypothetical protein